MGNIIKLIPKPATDHKWRPITHEEGKMAFEYYSAQEQRIKDLESGSAKVTPDEDKAIKKLLLKKMGVKDGDSMNELAKKDNERIQKKLDNKSLF